MTYIGKFFAWNPVLVTYNGISIQGQKGEQGSGGSAHRKFLLATPFRLLESAFSASSPNCLPKIQYMLENHCGYFKSKMAATRI